MTDTKPFSGLFRKAPAKDSDEYYPTPPWATRALMPFMVDLYGINKKAVIWEPAAGEGHMSLVLHEYFDTVVSTDLHSRGFCMGGHDFLHDEVPVDPDWCITNPPFNVANDFVLKALAVSKSGCAMLLRTNFLEGAERHDRIFSQYPPKHIIQFVGRIPFRAGRIAGIGESGTGAMAWWIWQKGFQGDPSIKWIPKDAEKKLTRPDDYPVSSFMEADDV